MFALLRFPSRQVKKNWDAAIVQTHTPIEYTPTYTHTSYVDHCTCFKWWLIRKLTVAAVVNRVNYSRNEINDARVRNVEKRVILKTDFVKRAPLECRANIKVH